MWRKSKDRVRKCAGKWTWWGQADVAFTVFVVYIYIYIRICCFIMLMVFLMCFVFFGWAHDVQMTTQDEPWVSQTVPETWGDDLKIFMGLLADLFPAVEVRNSVDIGVVTHSRLAAAFLGWLFTRGSVIHYDVLWSWFFVLFRFGRASRSKKTDRKCWKLPIFSWGNMSQWTVQAAH